MILVNDFSASVKQMLCYHLHVCGFTHDVVEYVLLMQDTRQMFCRNYCSRKTRAHPQSVLLANRIFCIRIVALECGLTLLGHRSVRLHLSKNGDQDQDNPLQATMI